jgi:hypothetical protein
MSSLAFSGFEVVILCPATGQMIPTGVEVRFGNLDTIPNEPMILTECPACGEPHQWSRSNAMLRRSSRSPP